MNEEIEAMIDNTLELSAVFVKLTHEKALVSKRDAEGKKYTGEEKCYVMKLKIKKNSWRPLKNLILSTRKPKK